MRRANLRRSEEAALNREAQALKVSPDPFRPPRREHPADVLDENPPCAGLHDDPPRGAPQVALVVAPEALSGEAVRLARDAANDAIHKAAPASASKGSGIRPHRRRSQETLLHRVDQVRDGEGFPLHHKDRSSAWHSELDAEVETAAAGAEGDVVEGM